MNSVSATTLSLSSKSEILFFRIGLLSGFSRTSSGPSENKSALGPRVVELRMEKGGNYQGKTILHSLR